MRTAATSRSRAGAILATAALSLGIALAPTPGPSEPAEAAAAWRVTEHAGAGLASDHDSVMTREIYPGYSLAEPSIGAPFSVAVIEGGGMLRAATF